MAVTVSALSFSVWQSVYVFDMNQAGMRHICHYIYLLSIMLWTNFFLFFISKEWIGMAVLCDAQTEAPKYFCYIGIDSTTEWLWSLQMVILTRFQANLQFCLWAPWTWWKTDIWSRYIYLITPPIIYITHDLWERTDLSVKVIICRLFSFIEE